MFSNKASSLPRMSLALQGGGAHGAFTWGVLDALLETDLFSFEGISGTSAGAMNAVAFADGWLKGGAEGARHQLNEFWSGVAARAPSDVLPPFADPSQPPPGMSWMVELTRWFSPYQLNPLDLNPLRDLVTGLFDFDALRKHSPFKLFVAATHANSGHLKLFRSHDISPDALLASACLPTLHHAVMIDGEPYWDGGYAANPAVFPLFRFCETRDILLVLLAPLQHERTPRGAAEIHARALDLGFNNAFLREMRLLVAMRDMAESSGWLSGTLEHHLRTMRFHMIESESTLGGLSQMSKISANLAFLHRLRDAGREAAMRWLARHGHAVGHRATIDVHEIFLPPGYD